MARVSTVIDHPSLSALDGTGSESNYDVLFSVVGYEARAAFVPERLVGRAVRELALGYHERQMLDFEEVRAKAVARGAEVSICDAGEFEDAVDGVANELGEGAQVAVDVSSMSRDRIAYTMFRLYPALAGVGGSLDLFYSPATYVVPSRAGVPTGVEVGSLYGFGDISGGVYLARAAVVGLGYESLRAEGALEHLEVESAILYVPNGFDKRFRSGVLRANSALLGSGASPVREYHLSQPDLLTRSLVRDLSDISQAYEVALLPMGPKIFAACCCVASLLSDSSFEIWRASGGQWEEPRRARASGKVVGLRLDWHQQVAAPGS